MWERKGPDSLNNWYSSSSESTFDSILEKISSVMHYDITNLLPWKDNQDNLDDTPKSFYSDIRLTPADKAYMKSLVDENEDTHNLLYYLSHYYEHNFLPNNVIQILRSKWFESDHKIHIIWKEIVENPHLSMNLKKVLIWILLHTKYSSSMVNCINSENFLGGNNSLTPRNMANFILTHLKDFSINSDFLPIVKEVWEKLEKSSK